VAPEETWLAALSDEAGNRKLCFMKFLPSAAKVQSRWCLRVSAGGARRLAIRDGTLVSQAKLT
jgi:hypothetical protein